MLTYPGQELVVDEPADGVPDAALLIAEVAVETVEINALVRARDQSSPFLASRGAISGSLPLNCR